LQKKRKYNPKKANTKKNDPESSLRTWILFTISYIFMIMYLSGMAEVYFPDPIHLGFGQYIALAAGVIWGGIAFYSVIMVIIFKKEV